MNLLELESLRFKEQNEEVRVEDLLARYEKRKKRADRLAVQLLELQHQKERRYAEYDQLRGDIARLERDHADAVQARDDAAAALAKAKGERKRLSEALAKERVEIDRLQADLEKLEAKRRALAAKRDAGAATE